MRRFLYPLFGLAVLALAACSGAPVGSSGATDLSPREQDQQTLLAYAAMQQVVLAAIQTPQVQANPDLKAKIKAGEQSARAALLDYDTQARKCLRDPDTGAIGNAPGQVCNPSDVVRALQSVSLAIAKAQTFAAQYAPTPKPPPAPPAVSSAA